MNAHGRQLTRWGVAYITKKHVKAASEQCPSLLAKRVHPHVFRHYVPFRIMSGNFAKTWFFRQMSEAGQT